jgi:amino acid transporter
MTDQATLKRSLSLPLVVFYGLGTIIGAGIYVLIGAVAGQAGMYAPLSFVLAAVIAGFTAFSYAELSSRLPRSAGEAVYLQEAFRRRWLSAAVGWAVVAVSVVSSATIVNGFVGYLGVFTPVPAGPVITLVVIALGLIAAWGIMESVWLAAVITVIEIGGLIFVILVAGDNLAQLPQRWPELVPPADATIWAGILLGAFLAFYAFIGFEDMVNVAEETRDASRAIPKAIVLALIISTLLYLITAVVAVLAVPVTELARNEAPLAAVMGAFGAEHRLFISGISLIAVMNGALIQIIKVSRVLYGMGHTGLAWRRLALINRHTRTPILATGLVTLLVLGMALWLPLTTLAQITSFITLTVFACVNLALVVLKRREPALAGIARYPVWVPVIGFILCLAFVVYQAASLYA